jgi:uncharacterized protein YjbJ (UPF0337 family)
MTDKNVDEAKGRVKEAAGSLTGDDELKDEGKVDQAASSVKDAADNVADKASDAVDKARDALQDK